MAGHKIIIFVLCFSYYRSNISFRFVFCGIIIISFPHGRQSPKLRWSRLWEGSYVFNTNNHMHPKHIMVYKKKIHTIPKHINECLKVHCKIGEKYIKRWWWAVSVILIRIRNKGHIILCLYACVHHNLTSVDLRRIKYIICCEGFLFEKVLVWVRSQYMLSVSGQIIPNGDDRRT